MDHYFLALRPDTLEYASPGELLMSAREQRSVASSKKGAKLKKEEDAFDIWLKRGLHQLFDDIANEPIPEELLRLLRDDQE